MKFKELSNSEMQAVNGGNGWTVAAITVGVVGAVAMTIVAAPAVLIIGGVTASTAATSAGLVISGAACGEVAYNTVKNYRNK